ncbi:anaphase-promoting complex subunit 13-like [Tenrec ecaudatus]|uniref:anaphase-promoting complex subunit 13-like n=1 Tax=Tenrec ecaudatus TaxID=94439 RepID=UPI003F591240
MDSEVHRDGRTLDLTDDAWREDKLPYEDVAIPKNELPKPEHDQGGTTESVKEQEVKWTHLALQYLHENMPPSEEAGLGTSSFWIYLLLKIAISKADIPNQKLYFKKIPG